MKKSTCALVFLAVVIFPGVLPANILFFFPGGNVSHKIAAWPWVMELAKRGHNVTFISSHEKTPKEHPNITDLASAPLHKMAASVYQVDRFKDRDEGTAKLFDYNTASIATCQVIADNMETDPIFRRLFNESSFDLVVVNAIFGECGLYVAKYFEAKTVYYSSCTFINWFYDTYGISPEAAWIPDIIFTSKSIPMGIWDRAYTTFIELYWIYYHNNLFSPHLAKAVEPLLGNDNVPSLYELENSVSVVLMNSHPTIDFARTLPPLFIDVAGMGILSNSQKELPKNFKDFLDSSGTGGAVLITFGSTVLLNKVSERYQEMFFDMFDALPHVNFLMRWSGPIPKFVKEQPKNLLLSEWLPQKEILSHPKLKAFITHGGISGSQEATSGGVPMIVMPLFADQDYNAYRIVAQEVGERVEISDMTADTLIGVVTKVITDDKYKRNMMKKSAIFRDRPMHPVDTAVFWTEFALRHDDTISTLRPQNQHLNIFQRRLVDVFLLFELVVIVAAIIFYYALKVTIKLARELLNFSASKAADEQKMKRKLRKVD